MDENCGNCFYWDETNVFCDELNEISHELQSCSEFVPKSPCCGDELDEDIMICPSCKEHC